MEAGAIGCLRTSVIVITSKDTSLDPRMIAGLEWIPNVARPAMEARARDDVRFVSGFFRLGHDASARVNACACSFGSPESPVASDSGDMRTDRQASRNLETTRA